MGVEEKGRLEMAVLTGAILAMLKRAEGRAALRD